MLLKFLLEKKLLSADQALEISIDYLKSVPSLLEVIKKESILSSDKVMELYCRAGVEQKSFYHIFKENSGLTEADFNQIIKNQQLRGRSLGEIVVQSGFMPQDKWDNTLREYMKSDRSIASNVSDNMNEETQPQASATPPSIGGGSISAAALESLKEVGGFDPAEIKDLEAQMSDTTNSTETENIVEINKSDRKEMTIYSEEFFDHLNESHQSELLVMANRYRLKKREKDLSLFYQNLTKILSLVKLCEFKYLEKLISPYETQMNLMMDKKAEVPDEWDSLVSDMLELIWDFRRLLFEEKTEAEIMIRPEIKSKYINNLKNIMTQIKR